MASISASSAECGRTITRKSSTRPSELSRRKSTPSIVRVPILASKTSASPMACSSTNERT